MSWYSFRPYVSVAQRRASAAKEAAKMAKKGIAFSPVTIPGRTIATTFWGKAWCKHLEAFSDYANRLPRGRTYVRNGSVIDLKIEPAKITAQVMGSSIYKQTITITPIADVRWKAIKNVCSGRIDSLVELLQGRFSDAVMAVITHRDEGMFPLPKEIKMNCSCPDWAGLCKHLAAVLYGVGARLDQQPELLFTLRQADHTELIAEAASGQALSDADAGDLDAASLADVFGIEIDTGSAPAMGAKPSAKAKSTPKPTPKSAPKPKKKTKFTLKPKAKVKLKSRSAPKTEAAPQAQPATKLAGTLKKTARTRASKPAAVSGKPPKKAAAKLVPKL